MKCESVEAGMEDMQQRRTVYEFAAHTLMQQRKDWLQLRRTASTAPNPIDRRNAREAVRNRPPPTWDECLALARRIHIKREIDHRCTL